jgi:hypothetical protein
MATKKLNHWKHLYLIQTDHDNEGMRIATRGLTHVQYVCSDVLEVIDFPRPRLNRLSPITIAFEPAPKSRATISLELGFDGRVFLSTLDETRPLYMSLPRKLLPKTLHLLERAPLYFILWLDTDEALAPYLNEDGGF